MPKYIIHEGQTKHLLEADTFNKDGELLTFFENVKEEGRSVVRPVAAFKLATVTWVEQEGKVESVPDPA